jgi:polyferredoxin
MKPAVSSNKKPIAIAAGLLVGGGSLWWYFRPFPWLGVMMGLLSGAFTFFILTTRHMERFRRALYIGLFAVVMTSVLVIIFNAGLGNFLDWVNIHERVYYLPGQTVGTLSYPCTRAISQVLLGKATFLPNLDAWQIAFPSNLISFLIILVPFTITALIFGRGICGWLCPFGGLNEAMVTGKKERWKLNFLKKATTTTQGLRYSGLNTWVKDVKYGMLVGVFLLSIFFFPVVCLYCPVLWLSSLPLFWTIIGLIVVSAIIMPFMTKRRWWCHICPLGAIFSLLDKVSLFQIKIDKKKCVKCLDCVQDCRMFALTPDSVTGRGRPDADCIRCGRCIEICPEEAVDMYLLGTSRKIRGVFISLAIIAILAWYTWFLFILADKIAGLF